VLHVVLTAPPAIVDMHLADTLVEFCVALICYLYMFVCVSVILSVGWWRVCLR